MGCALSDISSQKLKDDAKKQRLKKYGSSVGSKDMSDEHFSQQQKCLLRETWDILATNQQQHGVAIFMHIFSRQAETKQLFPFRDLEGDVLLKDSLFRSHSKRFMHAIETTINHLDALDLILVPVLHRLGERHIKISGFKLDYLSIFIESMLDVFAEALGKKFTKEVRAVWRHLGKFIAGKMTEGYQNALMSMGKYLASHCMDNVAVTVPENTDNCTGQSDSADAQSGNGDEQISGCHGSPTRHDASTATDDCNYDSVQNMRANPTCGTEDKETSTDQRLASQDQDDFSGNINTGLCEIEVSCQVDIGRLNGVKEHMNGITTETGQPHGNKMSASTDHAEAQRV